MQNSLDFDKWKYFFIQFWLLMGQTIKTRQVTRSVKRKFVIFSGLVEVFHYDLHASNWDDFYKMIFGISILKSGC